MNAELFAIDSPQDTALGSRAVVLRGFALPYLKEVLSDVEIIQTAAPFRHMVTPGGFVMSVAITNCGDLGWTTDRRGYRYTNLNPQTKEPWPVMPNSFNRLAQDAAAAAGFPDYVPGACLINCYDPGARLSLHQDKNEMDFSAPIVSVSLGMTAVFLFGGHERSDKAIKTPLYHGDVAVWGGEDRLRYHGVMPLKGDPHPLLGNKRINFTFRKAG